MAIRPLLGFLFFAWFYPPAIHAQTRVHSPAPEPALAFATPGRAEAESLVHAMAEKSSRYSLALAETRRRLDEERSLRIDVEKQLLSMGMSLLEAVYFETGQTEIPLASQPFLNIAAKLLGGFPGISIEIAGHTDNLGDDAANLRLSQGRAESVVRFIEQAAPELRGRLAAKGYGESMPKADNRKAAGRKLNRRTELTVLNQEALREYGP